MPQEIQASEGELLDRLEVIRGLISQGLTGAQIVKYVRKELNSWGVTDRQVRNYYNAVWKEMGNEATGVDRAAYFIRTLERLDYLYAKAVQISDLRTALTVIGTLIKLLRLDIPSADFDWKKAAEDAGVSPADLFEKVVQAVQASKELTHAETTDGE